MLKKPIKRTAAAAKLVLQDFSCRSMIHIVPALRNLVPGSWERPARWHAGMLRHLGRHEEALSLLECASVDMQNAQGLAVDLGEALAALNRHEEALAYWQRALKTSPSDQRLWHGYARLLQRLGRYDEMDDLFDRCLAAPGGGSENAVLATKLALRVSPLSFDAMARKAEQKIGDDAKKLRQLAHLHARGGNLGRALANLDRAEASSPGPRKAKRLKRKIHKVFRTLQSMPDRAASLPIDQLRIPEDVLTTMMRRSTPDALHQRQGLSMAVTTLGPGGAERQLTNTVNGLRKHGLLQQIKIVQTRSRDGRIDGFYQSQFGAPLVPITAVNDEVIDIERVVAERGEHLNSLLPLLPVSLRRYVSRYMTEFVKTRPQVVHCWSDQRNMTAGVAAVITGVPRVILSTRSIAPPGNRPAPRHFPAVYRALLSQPNIRMINNSRAGADTYEAWLGVEPGSIDVIYNGIDIERLQQARDPEKTRAHRQSLGLSDGTKLVGSLFRFSSEKRAMLWLKAAARLAARDSEVHFVLIGDGVEKARAMTYSRELGIAHRVHFLGLVKDVVPWYDAIDVVLLTSSREGTSNTILEAQALGRPVIATDVGGMGEAMVPGQSGFLVRAAPSPDEIADRLAFVLDNETWRRKAASVGTAFIQQSFSIERMTRDTFHLYEIEEDLLKTA